MILGKRLCFFTLAKAMVDDRLKTPEAMAVAAMRFGFRNPFFSVRRLAADAKSR